MLYNENFRCTILYFDFHLLHFVCARARVCVCVVCGVYVWCETKRVIQINIRYNVSHFEMKKC
jgi:hypothetical protein